MKSGSRLSAVIVWALLGYAEIGGVVHAFRSHRTSDGVTAIIVPPWAWFRSVEWIWHQRDLDLIEIGMSEQQVIARFGQPESVIEPVSGTRALVWPARNEGEVILVTMVSNRTLSVSLVLRDVLRQYGAK